MNDPRSSGQPRRSLPADASVSSESRPQPAGQPRRRRPISRAERRRRRRQARIRQLILLAIALAIGYFLGFLAGSASAESGKAPAPIDPPATSAPPATSEPVVTTGPVQPPEGPADTTAPTILGVNKLSLFLGSTVSYRSGILVTDDLDPSPNLTIDSSRVDLSTPGTYPVIYTATDRAGNASSVETTITVAEASGTIVDEATIQEKADKILSRILTDGMTPAEQVNAIYDYIEDHHYYVAKFDKTDYMQAAYIMMTENRGDCFGYYALSRLLFERLGLPNLTVTRTPNEVRTTNHWWNMVSLDGGETWYHFDSTPHLTYPTRTCLVTDAALEEFNQLMPNYYYFDHSSFPGTPDQ